MADRLAVGALDAAAVAQVVAQHQGSRYGGGHGLHRRQRGGGRCRLQGRLPMSPRGAPLACLQLQRKLQPRPKALHQGLHIMDQRTVHLDRKVQPGRLQGPVVRVPIVVEHIDAAAKSHQTVHDAQLAVQSTPAHGEKHIPIAQR